MNYHNITKCDMLNGEGLRVVLWVSGCEHNCKSCHNPQTHDINSGILFDNNAKNEIFEELSKDYISGITISGGDPLHHNNIAEIKILMQEIKTIYPTKTIIVYTGYKWEQIKDLNIVQYIDVLVDGKFIQDLYNKQLKWIGSSNQRIIDVQQSLKQNKVVLYNM